MTTELSNSTGLKFLTQMITIRSVEKRLLDLFSQGHLNGTVHTCIGQEACAVGVISALDIDRDVVFSNHRGHGHYLAYCDDVFGLIAEIIGSPHGVCQGIGGSQHIQRNNFYTNGIQGAGAPIAVGMALAEKLKHSGGVSVVFLGDGTFGEGVVYEAMNIAGLWRLPVLFAVEHNFYAQTTPSEQQHAGDLSERGRSFGLEIRKVDGMDVAAVYTAAKTAIAVCREQQMPQILFMETYRFGPHSKGDDYRDTDEIERFKARDPIMALANQLEAMEMIAKLEAAAIVRIDKVVNDVLEGIG